MLEPRRSIGEINSLKLSVFFLSFSSDKYLIVAVNKNNTVKNASTNYEAKEFTNLLLGRTGIIAFIIVAVFVLAIVIISFD